jgi:small conductance mechanosensitive channel
MRAITGWCWPRYLMTLLVVVATTTATTSAAWAQEQDAPAEAPAEEPSGTPQAPVPLAPPAPEEEQADQPEQAPADQPLDDEQIRQRLDSIFSFVEPLDQVDVEVQSGVVRLTGQAASQDARTQAEELARTPPGVVFVDNQIDEAVDVADRLSPTVERLQGFAVEFVRRIPLFLLAIFIVVVFWQLSRLLVIWEWPFKKMTSNVLARGLIKQALRVVIVLGGLLIALDLLDATTVVGAVLGTAGVFGIALGFAFRDIAENYLASILLSTRRPFEANDLVEIEKICGRVVRLTMRETILMTLDGNHVRIANATVFKSNITNFTRNPRRRFDFTVGVGTQEDLTRALAVGIAALRKMDGVLDEPRPFGHVRELAESCVILWFTGWVDQRTFDFAKVKSEATRQLKEAFDEAEIDMPSPIYVIEMTERQARKQEQRPEGEPAQEVAAEAEAEADVVDIGLDHDLERQIDEDRRLTGDEDLLDSDEE